MKEKTKRHCIMCDRDRVGEFYGSGRWCKGCYFGQRRRAIQKRKKRKYGTIQGIHTEEQWQDLLIKCKHRCFGCGLNTKRLTRDHIIPISKGGNDNIENVLPLCKSCNSSKHTEGAEWYILQLKKRLTKEQQGT